MSTDPRPSRPVTLLPAYPNERTGWGRFLRIVTTYPTAPVELLIGLSNVLRGGYVALPGHHPPLEHFPSLERFVLALVMAGLGSLQVWSCLWERSRLRGIAAVCLVALLVYIGVIYSRNTDPGDLGRTIILFYFIMAVGEFWISFRTPPIVPLWRWMHHMNGHGVNNAEQS
jgi:hypothetical protein